VYGENAVKRPWAMYCEQFVEMSDTQLMGEARTLDYMVGAGVCYGRRDIGDFEAVRDVLESRGFDLRKVLKFFYRDFDADPLTEEEMAEEGRRLASEGLIYVIPQEDLDPD
jgi:hypothetical protein